MVPSVPTWDLIKPKLLCFMREGGKNLPAPAPVGSLHRLYEHDHKHWPLHFKLPFDALVSPMPTSFHFLHHNELRCLLATGTSPPSELNGRFFYICLWQALYIPEMLYLSLHAHSRLPAMHSIQLVSLNYCVYWRAEWALLVNWMGDFSIYMSVTGTVHNGNVICVTGTVHTGNVIRASNFACALPLANNA